MLSSRGPIQEGKSFIDSPDGFVCLDCGKVTNQAYRGTNIGKPMNENFSPATSSADAHPVSNLNSIHLKTS